jgi:hypothetical protein
MVRVSDGLVAAGVVPPAGLLLSTSFVKGSEVAGRVARVSDGLVAAGLVLPAGLLFSTSFVEGVEPGERVVV